VSDLEQLPELLEVLVTEFRDGGIDATLVPPTLGAPPQLVVPIEDPTLDADRHLRINTFFVPDLDDPPVLQYFVALPYAVTMEHVDALARFLCTLNTNLPMAGFELSERNEAIVFRHTHAISVRPLDPGVIAWSWAMIRSAVIEFGPLVERVAAGLELEVGVTSMDELLSSFSDG